MMKLASILTLAFYTCFQTSNAYIHFEMEKMSGKLSESAVSHKDVSHLYKRSDNYGGWVADSVQYAIELELGSQNQTVNVLVDTGSHDLWVNDGDSNSANCALKSQTTIETLTLENVYPFTLTTLTTVQSGKTMMKRDESSTATTETTAWNIFYVSVTATTDVTVTNVATVTVKTTDTHHTSSSSTSSLSSTESSTTTSSHASSMTTSRPITFSMTSRSSSSSSSSEASNLYPLPTYQVNDVIAQDYAGDCYSWGVFDTSNSNSYKALGENYEGISPNGATINGKWVVDKVQFGGVSIKNLTFVVIEDSNEYGVLGLALPSNTSNENLPMKMKSQGLINKIAYSIGASSSNLNSKGSLIIGGVDLNQANGDFSIVPLLEFENDVSSKSLAITLSEIFNFDDSLLASGLTYAILDTTSIVGSVPYYIYDEIVLSNGFKYNEDTGNFVAKYNDLTNKNITWNLQGFNFTTPLIDLVLPLYDDSNDKFSDFVVLALQSNSDDYVVFGDAMLSNIYFIVDLEDNQISLANRQFGTQVSQNIIDIPSQGAISRATTANSYSQTVGFDNVTELKLARTDDINTVQSTSLSQGLSATRVSYISSFPSANSSSSYKGKVSFHKVTCTFIFLFLTICLL